MGKEREYKPNFAWEMAEEYGVNIEPYQFEPMASASDGWSFAHLTTILTM